MLPEEAQATMAKVLLLIFATLMFCFSKARADSPKHKLSTLQVIVKK
tara:strand:- start:274 stop:414 length:141 start_codon:yes stop_codon:yes gene_type:complete